MHPGLLLHANPRHGSNQCKEKTTLYILSLISCRSWSQTKYNLFCFSRLHMAMQTHQPGLQVPWNFLCGWKLLHELIWQICRADWLAEPADWLMCYLITSYPLATHTSTGHATLLHVWQQCYRAGTTPVWVLVKALGTEWVWHIKNRRAWQF